MREASNSLNKSVEPSLKVFDMSLIIFQIEHNKFILYYVKATMQVL